MTIIIKPIRIGIHLCTSYPVIARCGYPWDRHFSVGVAKDKHEDQDPNHIVTGIKIDAKSAERTTSCSLFGFDIVLLIS
jgi:hypothetical protein